MFEVPIAIGLLLNRHPNAVRASVEERRLQQPRSLPAIAEALRAQVEVPFGTSQSELVSGGSGIRWRCIDRWIRIGRIAVLDCLKRVNACGQRRSETHCIELHRDGAVQFE